MRNAVRERNRQSIKRGFTLLELIIASLILSVVSIGAIGYQYHARRMALRANAEITAARTGRMILDNWKKNGGDENFDLEDLEMGFVKQAKIADRYTVSVDGLQMQVTLNWQDIEEDDMAMVTLRQIEARIQWRSDYMQNTVRDTDPSYVISTYVRKDEAGG
jgi:prepilin-type N-terminal cleavage/methylation domain-containing protein